MISSPPPWDNRISPHLKFGLWDYDGFEIGITGLQDPPMGTLIIDHEALPKQGDNALGSSLFVSTRTAKPYDL